MGSANSLKLKVTKPLGVPHDVCLARELEGWGDPSSLLEQVSRNRQVNGTTEVTGS